MSGLKTRMGGSTRLDGAFTNVAGGTLCGNGFITGQTINVNGGWYMS